MTKKILLDNRNLIWSTSLINDFELTMNYLDILGTFRLVLYQPRKDKGVVEKSYIKYLYKSQSIYQLLEIMLEYLVYFFNILSTG